LIGHFLHQIGGEVLEERHVGVALFLGQGFGGGEDDEALAVGV
jgi:hypothetical protein